MMEDKDRIDASPNDRWTIYVERDEKEATGT